MELGSNLRAVEKCINETEAVLKSQNNFDTGKINLHDYGLPSSKNTNVNNLDPSTLVIRKVGKRFLCPICERSFTMRSNLKRHVKFKHPRLMSTLFPVNPGIIYKCSTENNNVNNLDPSTLAIRKVGKLFICPVCEQSFTMRHNLKKHVKFQHPQLISISSTLFSANPDSAYRCTICQTNYKSIRSLQEHSRRVHKRCWNIKKHKCPLCPQEIERRNFDEHFKKIHNLKLDPIKLVFDSYGKFCEWKKAIESLTKSSFIKQTAIFSKETTRYRFICHRFGDFESLGEDKRKLKAQGSRKINAFCPAIFRVVKMKDGKCEVEFQGQHLGHGNELEHLHLTFEEKKYIAKKLATNLPLDDILDEIRSTALENGDERLCILKRKDLHNVKNNFMKNNQFSISEPEPDKKLFNILKDIHSKHVESERIKAEIINIERGWVITLLGCDETYLIKENSKSCDCSHICIYCRVCIKAYTCSCSDSCIKENMCKHIHFFCIEKQKTHDNSNSTLEYNNYNMSTISNSEQCLQTINTLESSDLSQKNAPVIINSITLQKVDQDVNNKSYNSGSILECNMNVVSNLEQCLQASNNKLESRGLNEKETYIDSTKVEEDCQDGSSSLDCNHYETNVDSDPEQSNSSQKNNIVESSESKEDIPILIDSEKINSLKNKFSELIASITTEKEYAVSESTYQELAAELKTIQNHSTDA